jgi:hypothetical protein
MGESATLRRETGYQTSECKGRKASAPSQTESHVEQVAKDNESEGVYVRAVMDNLPTLARSPVPGQAAGPKMGEVFGPYNTRVYGIHSEGDPVQSNVLRPRKMDARNGGTRQRLSRQREQAARPYALAGRMAQEAKAPL